MDDIQLLRSFGEGQELPADQRAPVVKAYLKRAPGARPHVPVDKDAPLSDFQNVAPRFPVFRVVPIKG